MKTNHQEKAKDQGIIQQLTRYAATSILVFVLSFNASVLVTAHSVNEAVARSAAKVVANAKDVTEAAVTCKKLRHKFDASTMISDVQAILHEWGINDSDHCGYVYVKSIMTVNLPVSIPGVPVQVTLISKAQEPILVAQRKGLMVAAVK